MRMLSRLSLTAYGGIGVITPTDGEAILIMVGVDTHLITVTVAGIPVAVDTGEATIGGVVIHIRTGATAEHVVRQLHGVLTELVE